MWTVETIKKRYVTYDRARVALLQHKDEQGLEVLSQAWPEETARRTRCLAFIKERKGKIGGLANSDKTTIDRCIKRNSHLIGVSGFYDRVEKVMNGQTPGQPTKTDRPKNRRYTHDTFTNSTHLSDDTKKKLGELLSKYSVHTLQNRFRLYNYFFSNLRHGAPPTQLFIERVNQAHRSIFKDQRRAPGRRSLEKALNIERPSVTGPGPGPAFVKSLINAGWDKELREFFRKAAELGPSHVVEKALEILAEAKKEGVPTAFVLEVMA